MKKFFIGLVMLAVLAVGLPIVAEAHPNCRRHREKILCQQKLRTALCYSWIHIPTTEFLPKTS